MKPTALFFFVSIFMTFSFLSFSAMAEQPGPGRQAVESVELPASTSTWDYGREKMKNIGEPRPVDTSRQEAVRYWIYLPEDYERQAEAGGAPLMLFLHGAGERGDTPEEIGKVKVHGPPKLLDRPEFRKNWTCITVSPQCKNNFAWSPGQLMLLLDHIEKNYKVDKSRIYVTGISMGGFGSWMCLREAPERFAAAAPICGGALPEWAETLKDIPVWNFHGDKDGAVPFALSQGIVDAIKRAGGRRIIFTVYEGAGHDVWTRTYENQLLYDWLLSFSR